MNNEKLLNEISCTIDALNEDFYGEDISLGDIESFKKVVFHLKKDFPDYDFSHLVELVNKNYGEDLSYKRNNLFVDLSSISERRMYSKKGYRKRLGVIISQHEDEK